MVLCLFREGKMSRHELIKQFQKLVGHAYMVLGSWGHWIWVEVSNKPGVKGQEKVGKGEMSQWQGRRWDCCRKTQEGAGSLGGWEAMKRGKPKSWIKKGKRKRALPLHSITLPTFLIFGTKISSWHYDRKIYPVNSQISVTCHQRVMSRLLEGVTLVLDAKPQSLCQHHQHFQVDREDVKAAAWQLSWVCLVRRNMQGSGTVGILLFPSCTWLEKIYLFPLWFYKTYADNWTCSLIFCSHLQVQTHPTSSRLASMDIESVMTAWGWKTLGFFSLLISPTHGTNCLEEDPTFISCTAGQLSRNSSPNASTDVSLQAHM